MSVIFEKLFIYIIIHYCMSVKILYISFIGRKYTRKPSCIKNIYIPLFSLMMTVTVGCSSCLNTIRQQHVLLIIILMCFGNTPAIRYTKNLWKSFFNLNNEIVIYRSEDGKTRHDVKLEGDTVWLSQQQMSELFEKDRTVIGRHIRNIFKEGELQESLVCAKFAHTKDYGRRKGFTQEATTTLYNLDVIISVGYRVKSKRGVKFRQWASSVLKQYLIKGYAVNESMRKKQVAELRQLVQMLGRTLRHSPDPLKEEQSALVDVVVDYTYALDTLDDYDYQRLGIRNTTAHGAFRATYEGAMQEIRQLREKFGGSALFGNEKDDSFRSSIGQIYQTFDGMEPYPSVEEKAAMLLYLVVKNHSFSDGNKRIAATLFLWFMNNNGILYREDGTKRIADNTLVAITLMIAESRTEEKDVMVSVVVNLINKSN